MKDLPPLPIVADALRGVTETLALELSRPRADAPAWGPFEWNIARAVADMQGISGVLAGTLRWSGPTSWQEFLAGQAQEIAQRDVKIGALLESIDQAARKHSVAVIALKGSALRTLGLWPAPQRPMGDVDLLVKPEDLATLTQALTNIDYEHHFTSRRNVVFKPRGARATGGFGERALNPIPLEVHTRIAERLPASEVEITTRLWPVKSVSGINPYASQSALFCHLALHCAGDMRGGALRLIQLRDLGQFALRLTPDDWSELISDASCWWLFPVLRISERYFPRMIPHDALEKCRRRCPPWLRWASERAELTDVSWSNVHIEALPGMEWSRTPLELLRYVRRRALPDRVVYAELAHWQESLPQLQTFSWYRQRHLTRILRWLFTRPPRVETISSVMAALDSDSAAAPAGGS
jgi:hypothetical protein